MSPASWRVEALGELQKRRQEVPLKETKLIVSQCQKLWIATTKKEQQLNTLREKLIVAKHEATEIHSTGAGGDEKLKKKLLQLHQETNKLQSELSQKYKDEAQYAKKQLELSKELRETIQKRDAMKECYTDYKSRLENMTIDFEAQKLQIQQLQGDLKLVQGEHDRGLEEVKQARISVRQAKEEREIIVTRTLAEKQRMVEELNEMTGAIERYKARILELEEEVKKLKQTLSDGATDSEAFGFESIQGFGEAAGVWVNTNDVRPPTKMLVTVKAHSLEATCVCFSEESNLVGTGSSDGTVKLWKPGDLNPTATLYPSGGTGSGHSQPVMCVSIHGAYIVAGSSDFKCRVWSLDTQRVIHTLTGHSGKVYACQFTPDCRMVVTGGTDRKLMVWDMSNGYRMHIMSCGSMCNGIDINQPGNMLASVHQDNSLKLWDLRAARLIQTLPDKHSGPITSVKFTKDSNQLLTCCKDGLLRLFDAITLQCLARFGDPGFTVTISWCMAALSPNGKYVAAGSTSGTLFVWEVDSGTVVSKLRRAKSELEDSTISLGHVSSRTSGARGRAMAIEAVAWSPDGQLVAVSDYGGYLTYYHAS